MADNFPTFPFTTQEDWYGELSFISADDGEPLSLQGRTFVMLITPATSGADLVEPKITLTMDAGGGLSLKTGDPSTIIFRVSKETANNLQRMEYTADILEVSGGSRYLFMPARIQYFEPSALRTFLSRFLGAKVSFSARRQPIITPLAIAGREGPPGATIITRTVPPVSGDGKNGDYFIEDRTASGQGRWMYGPKANGVWPTPPWSIQPVGGRTAVYDATYECKITDVQVGVATLTKPLTIYLPNVDDYPVGQDLVIADESGACSGALTISIQPHPTSNDMIGGADNNTIVLFQAYQAQGFRRGAANLWVRY